MFSAVREAVPITAAPLLLLRAPAPCSWLWYVVLDGLLLPLAGARLLAQSFPLPGTQPLLPGCSGQVPPSRLLLGVSRRPPRTQQPPVSVGHLPSSDCTPRSPRQASWGGLTSVFARCLSHLTTGSKTPAPLALVTAVTSPAADDPLDLSIQFTGIGGHGCSVHSVSRRDSFCRLRTWYLLLLWWHWDWNSGPGVC
jgi:hypothetical protein